MPEENLPPFGIRGLCSPDKSYSVLEITERQYDASLHSYPDSALTWHDEDDGETVTVGSGWELRERLKDRVPATNPCIKFHDKWTGRVKDQYIHLFDISNSHTSLDVWKEHEAYYSKTQTSAESSPVTGSRDQEQDLKADLKSDDQTSDAEYVTQVEESSNAEEVISLRGEDITHPNTVVDMPVRKNISGRVEGLGSQLGHLAGFLQSTSESLRKAAEKTRETDTSQVEDILTGMTTVLGEVGAFGLDVIEKISEKAPKPEAEAKLEPERIQQPPLQRVQVEPPTNSPTQELRQMTGDYLFGIAACAGGPLICDEDKDIEYGLASQYLLDDREFQEKLSVLQALVKHDLQFKHADRPRHPDLERIVLIQLLALNMLASPKTDGKATGEQSHERHRHVLSQLLLDMHPNPINNDMTEGSKQPLPVSQQLKEPLKSAASSSAEIPILDQQADAEDAAFSARFPPLMCPRQTWPFSVPKPYVPNGTVPMRTASFKTGYMDRPRPQVFDAETQRRRHFAKTCFPAQAYTPGPKPTVRMPSQPKYAPVIPLTEHQTRSESVHGDAVSTHTRDFADEAVVNPAEEADKNTSKVVDEEIAISPCVETHRSSSANSVVSPPGAWPEATGQASTQSMCPPNGSQTERYPSLARLSHLVPGKTLYPTPSQASHHRLQRHRSLMNPGASVDTLNGLQRSQSLTASNPAARLNGPFKPWFPAPVPPKLANEQDPTIPKFTGGPVRTLHRSISDRRPRSLYEPYRSSNAHRVFEPVWEGQTEAPQKDYDPNPGVVIVDASNFEPGTTEQDIRDLLADDCRTVIGINTLISCRIIATEPEVLAKLVIKDKTNADAVIDKYNKKWIKGRPLKVEYAKFGLDARINRLRGAFPAPSPRHLRSVPDLRMASNPKPPFPAFVSQARPIIQPAATGKHADKSMPPTPLPSQPALPPAFAGNLIHECEKKLMDMGYGLLDPTMLPRLHVYACAANGDIHEAIEMIEDDKKANDFETFHKKVNDAREERWGKHEEDNGADDSDAYNEDLEKAIKLSLEQ